MRHKSAAKEFSTATFGAYNFLNKFSQRPFYKARISRSIKPQRNQIHISNAYIPQISDYDYLIAPTVKSVVYNKREYELLQMHLF